MRGSDKNPREKPNFSQRNLSKPRENKIYRRRSGAGGARLGVVNTTPTPVTTWSETHYGNGILDSRTLDPLSSSGSRGVKLKEPHPGGRELGPVPKRPRSSQTRYSPWTHLLSSGVQSHCQWVLSRSCYPSTPTLPFTPAPGTGGRPSTHPSRRTQEPT